MTRCGITHWQKGKSHGTQMMSGCFVTNFMWTWRIAFHIHVLSCLFISLPLFPHCTSFIFPSVYLKFSFCPCLSNLYTFTLISFISLPISSIHLLFSSSLPLIFCLFLLFSLYFLSHRLSLCLFLFLFSFSFSLFSQATPILTLLPFIFLCPLPSLLRNWTD